MAELTPPERTALEELLSGTPIVALRTFPAPYRYKLRSKELTPSLVTALSSRGYIKGTAQGEGRELIHFHITEKGTSAVGVPRAAR